MPANTIAQQHIALSVAPRPLWRFLFHRSSRKTQLTCVADQFVSAPMPLATLTSLDELVERLRADGSGDGANCGRTEVTSGTGIDGAARSPSVPLPGRATGGCGDGNAEGPVGITGTAPNDERGNLAVVVCFSLSRLSASARRAQLVASSSHE